MLSKIPFLITVFGMIGGVAIAIVFGVNEDLFKDRIAHDLQQNAAVHAFDSIENPEKRKAAIKKEKDKNWRYYQRYHFHATGIGAMSLSLLILLAFVRGSGRLRTVAAYSLALGGFLYPFVWLFAGLYGPVVGRSIAKEQFAIFGYMGGLFLLGALLTLALAALFPLRFHASDQA